MKICSTTGLTKYGSRHDAEAALLALGRHDHMKHERCAACNCLHIVPKTDEDLRKPARVDAKKERIG